MAEIPGDKVALGGERAMSTRGLEITLDELKNKHSNALAELGRKGSAIDRIKIEHEAQKIEFVVLKAEVVTLTDRLTAAGKEIDAIKVECYDLVSLAPTGWPEDKEFLNHAADARDLGQRIEPDGDRFDDGRRLQPAESSIGASSSTGMRIPSNLVHILMVGLVCFGAAFAWQEYDGEGAKALFGRVASLSFLTESATKSPPDVEVAAKQTVLPSVAQVPAHDARISQPDPVAPAPPPPAAAAPLSDQNELTTRQQQLPNELRTDEQETKIQASSPPSQNATTSPEMNSSGLNTMPVQHNGPTQPLQNDPKLTPTEKPAPKTIEAWSLQEVRDGTAVLQGPSGTLRVTTGDTISGLGKVTTIARWGKGWVVATSAGYCVSARPDHANGICKPYRGN
jgi:hypothetical protein